LAKQTEEEEEVQEDEQQEGEGEDGNSKLRNETIWKSLQIISGLWNLHEQKEIDATAHSLLEGIKKNLNNKQSENEKQLRRKTNFLLEKVLQNS